MIVRQGLASHCVGSGIPHSRRPIDQQVHRPGADPEGVV